MSRATQVDVLWGGLRDEAGDPLSAGLVYVYKAGTTTPQAMYSARDKSAYASNPIVLDSNGQALAYGDGVYKLVVKDSGGTELFTYDNLLYTVPDEGVLWGGSATGSSNAYVLSPSPSLTLLQNGQQISWVPNHTNTGASTIDVSGLGAIAVERANGDALSASDLTSGQLATVTYDTITGTARFILSITSSYSAIIVTGTATIGEVVTDTVSSASNMVIGPTAGLTTLGLVSANTTHITLEADGDLVPATATDLGSSVSPFGTAYCTDVEVGNDLTVSGQFIGCDVTGDVTVSGSVGTSVSPISKVWCTDLDIADDLVVDDDASIGGTLSVTGVTTCTSILTPSIGSSSGWFTLKAGGNSCWAIDATTKILIPSVSGTDFGSASNPVGDIVHNGYLTVAGVSVPFWSYSSNGNTELRNCDLAAMTFDAAGWLFMKKVILGLVKDLKTQKVFA